MEKCYKCGNAKLLIMSGVGYFNADEEPYKSGVEEESEIKELESNDLIIFYCEKCGIIVDIWINDEDYCLNHKEATQ